MKAITAVDLFCGAGGESTGLKMAADSLGRDLDLLAINHWDIAIDTHSANHKYAKHMCETVQSVDPVKAIPSGKLDLLWASPECTHFSNARGGKPKDDQSRASVEMIMDWLKKLDVQKVIIENVKEFRTWGPLDEKGHPIKERKGEFFHKFIRDLERLGYTVDHRILCAADYGDPTTRERFFLQAVKSSEKIVWPFETHSAEGSMFPDKKWKSAKDIIDWSLPGQSIFNRKKPLCDNTIARIEAGIEKYWGDWAEPFLIVLRGTSPRSLKSTALSTGIPLPTITASGGHIGLVQPLILHQMSGGKIREVSEPVPAITTKCGHGLVQPFIITHGHTSSMRIRPVADPLTTIVSKAEHGLLQPFLIPYYGNSSAVDINDPLDTVPTKDRFALIEGNTYTLDIRYRMLQPHELAAAQGFPVNYIFSGNKTETVKQIGNAVPVNTAKALCEAILRGVD